MYSLIINDQFEKRNLSDKEIVDKLTLIGCTLKSKEYGWDVAVIPNRSQDLIREIDLIEEIARLIGMTDSTGFLIQLSLENCHQNSWYWEK